MAIQPGVWGIDLGQCALKALRLELVDGQVTATAFDYVEHPKILSQPDADPDQLTREALEKFLSRNTLKGDLVAISVPGQSGLARFVKLPPVEEKKIGEIVKFEAKQQIPFNLDEVVWDYQKIGQGMVTDGFAMETEIGLFAMKRDMVSRYLQHFKDVNVEVHVVQMAPLCLCNYVAYDLLGINADAAPEPGAGKKKAVVALDIGADSSNLVVTDGNRIIWQRPIPLGGNHFTRALTKDLKLTFAKAEHLKRNATKSGGAELKQILTALKPVLNDFVGEVQRSLGYFTNTHRDAQVEYMVGLGSAFRLPGLQRFVAEKLSLDVRKLQKLERLAGEGVVAAPTFTENVLSFAVAYGLALQGLKAARLQTNLLPPEIQTERLIRAKKPWAAAAAAALLAGTALGPYLGYAVGFNSVNTKKEPLAEAVKKSETVASRASSLSSAYDAKKKEAEEEEKAVRAIIAGLDERFNWIQLNKFISDAMPRPDGTNLAPSARKDFFVGKGEAAYQRFLKRQATVKTGGREDPVDVDPELIQFSVTSVDARYADDLSALWTKLTVGNPAQVNERDIRPSWRQKEAPKEKQAGWVVELRGYTYNQGGRRFVLDGLVEAIARAGIKTKPAGAGGAAPATTTPSTGDATAAAPASGGTSGDAAAPAEGEDTPEDVKKPIIDRITHVLLYKASSSDQPGGVDLVRSGVVGGLVGGGGGGGGMGSPGEGGPGGAPGGLTGAAGPGGGMVGAAPGPGGGGFGGGGSVTSSVRSSWAPLVSGGGGGGGGGIMGGMGGGGFRGTPGGSSGGGGMAPPGADAGGPAAPGPGMPPGGSPALGGGATGGKPLPGGRTEFIVLFFWREPTPSDQYLPTPIEEGAAGGGMGGMDPKGGGGMSPPGGGGSAPAPGGGEGRGATGSRDGDL